MRALLILSSLTLALQCSAQCRNALFIDFRAGTNLGVVTADVLRRSTIGDTNKFGWIVATNPYNTLYQGALTFSTSAQHSLSGAVNFCTGGTQTGNGSSIGLVSVLTTNDFQLPATCYLTNTGPSLSVGVWMKWLFPNTNSTPHDLFTIYGDSSESGTPFSNFLLFQSPSGLTQSVQHEVTPFCAAGACAQSSDVPLPSTNWYWCTLKYQMGTATPNNRLQVRDTNLTVLVDMACGLSCDVTNWPRFVPFGIQNQGVNATNQVVMYGSAIIDFDGTWPLLPQESFSNVVRGSTSTARFMAR